jgi:hypothetical protein
MMGNPRSSSVWFRSIPCRSVGRTTELWSFRSSWLWCALSYCFRQSMWDEAGCIWFITTTTWTNGFHCQPNGPFLIITGTPPQGTNAINHEGSISARVAMVHLSDPRPDKQVVQSIYISSICVLNVWTLFGGDPYLYPLFSKVLFAQMDDSSRSKCVLGEKCQPDL